MLTKRGVQKWLNSFEDEETVIGESSSDDNCPLANFLKTTGMEDPRVNEYAYREGRYADHEIRLTGWAEEFIRGIDRLTDVDTKHWKWTPTKITVKQAKEIFAGVV